MFYYSQEKSIFFSCWSCIFSKAANIRGKFFQYRACQKLLKDSQQQSQQQDEQQQDASQNQPQNEDQQQQQTEEQQKKDDKQTQQLLNLAKQAEKRAKEKVDKAMKNRRPKNLEKNW